MTTATNTDADFMRTAEPHRRELLAHCYRMSGSLSDAEDLVQETFVRAWQSRASFEGQASLRTWLYRIATNASIDLLRARKRRSLPPRTGNAARGADAMPAPTTEPVWLEPFPDELLPDDLVPEQAPGPEARVGQRESVAFAFLVAIHELTPQQRAIVLLRDVLGWTAAETAAALDTTVVATNSALQRARAALDDAAGDVTSAPDIPSDPATRSLLERYVNAWEQRDVAALAAMLTDESVLSMPPIPSWYRGPRDICDALVSAGVLASPTELVLRPLRANGSVAFAGWHRAIAGDWAPLGLQVITLRADAVRDVTCFIGGAFFPRFGLPLTPPNAS